MEPILAVLHDRLGQQGFDIIHPFAVQPYNEAVAAKVAAGAVAAPSKTAIPPLPTYGRSRTAAVRLGHSNGLWPRFVDHLKANPAAIELDNPLDTFLSAAVQPAVEEVARATGAAVDLRLSSDVGDKFVDLGCVAEVSGLAYYNAALHLSLHPKFGPWFAMRAVLVVDVDFDDAMARVPASVNPIADLEDEIRAQHAALKAAGGIENWRSHWRAWADLRKLGGRGVDPQYVYAEDQIEYHYTGNRDVLRRIVAGR